MRGWLLGIFAWAVMNAASGAQPAPGALAWRNAAVIGGGALAVGVYGMSKWWSDGFTGEFHTVNEGWFARDTPYGGADKLGHAYFSYAGTRLLARGFESIGNDSAQALRLGLWSTLGIMTAVELADGYSKRFAFSAQDVAMNVAGAGLGYLMERHPRLDRLFDFRLHYWPSHDSDFDIAGDYSGQTYLIVAKASGVPALRGNPWLRYFELAAGYGTRDYDELGPGRGTRHLYFGISLNLSELLRRTVYHDDATPSRTQRASEMLFEYIQLPGTAVPLVDHKF